MFTATHCAAAICCRRCWACCPTWCLVSASLPCGSCWCARHTRCPHKPGSLDAAAASQLRSSLASLTFLVHFLLPAGKFEFQVRRCDSRHQRQRVLRWAAAAPMLQASAACSPSPLSSFPPQPSNHFHHRHRLMRLRPPAARRKTSRERYWCWTKRTRWVGCLMPIFSCKAAHLRIIHLAPAQPDRPSLLSGSSYSPIAVWCRVHWHPTLCTAPTITHTHRWWSGWKHWMRQARRQSEAVR